MTTLKIYSYPERNLDHRPTGIWTTADGRRIIVSKGRSRPRPCPSSRWHRTSCFA